MSHIKYTDVYRVPQYPKTHFLPNLEPVLERLMKRYYIYWKHKMKLTGSMPYTVKYNIALKLNDNADT